MNKRMKRKLEDFMKDETGKVSKKNIMKIGVGTISAIGLMSSMSALNAHALVTHSNAPSPDSVTTVCGDGTHANHASHSSHSSY